MRRAELLYSAFFCNMERPGTMWCRGAAQERKKSKRWSAIIVIVQIRQCGVCAAAGQIHIRKNNCQSKNSK